ncbi:hypothetical protein BO70DRAFT_75875 [Aspergillus heteromorphus CBS 117.55]|uniref:Terpenoid synthase n=1 Tax=Aspergillus heteromorphus CBS 117.55 TaxID=1448321 RepID=A0A317X169_9EURO|nr:uncharacterized protein BO70DRAFT_75875 [Aspergillus heteromorphus CBS 117.55]PWY90688.1 hypothetical protein BO70DRAFT_75875 [Aspergillus heteromorphus CBS 117.55]
MYDYLNGGVKYLSPPFLSLNRYMRSRCYSTDSPEEGQFQRSDNAIELSPLQAGFPWPSGIVSCRQTKHQDIVMKATKALLREYTVDKTAQQLRKAERSIADIARGELATDLEHSWVRFVIHGFSEGDRQRMKLLANINVHTIVLDDFWEMNHIEAFNKILENYVDRMRPDLQDRKPPVSALQADIDRTVDEILELDRTSGNTAGQELLENVVRFFTRPPPPSKYKNMEEYMKYRHEDIAILYIIKCCKFSMNSPVDTDSPKLARYLRLFKDHVLLVNDLASWEKEKRAYDKGKAQYLTNAVNVVYELFHLPTYRAAVGMTQALVLELETEIDAEIDRLIGENAFTTEEWRFVDTTLNTLGGNVFCSMVMERYGGAKARLP